jgi:hypothetical protein
MVLTFTYGAIEPAGMVEGTSRDFRDGKGVRKTLEIFKRVRYG